MKATIIRLSLVMLTAASLTAKEAKEPKEPRGHRPPPIIAVLDANRDGVISAEEIANAPNTLLHLDKNDDGELTREELHPEGPPPQEGREAEEKPAPPEDAE
jgi:hypothetical protein